MMPATAQKNIAAARLRLADLLIMRLCHDLSGAAMAVFGAIDAASANDPGAASAAADVFLQRLRFYRAAWSQTGDPVRLADLRTLAKALPRGTRIRIEISGFDDDASLQPADGRVLLNVLLLAAESLPAGGVITVARDSAAMMIVRIDGPRAAWPAGLGAVLADPGLVEEALSAAGAGATKGLIGAVTALVAAACGVRIKLLMAAVAEDAPPLAVELSRDD